MAVTEQDVTTYLCMLPLDKGEKKRIHDDVLEFSKLYLKGKTWPSESDYEEYRRMKSRKAHDSIRGENAERRVREYFKAHQKGEKEMNETENKQNEILERAESTSIAESVNESTESTETYEVQEKETEKKKAESTSQDINLENEDKELQGTSATESKQNNSLENEVSAKTEKPEKAEKKIGRPRKSKEARENKVNLYLTDSMMADVKALQALRGITSVTDYIIAVLNDEIVRKQDTLKIFRQIKEY